VPRSLERFFFSLALLAAACSYSTSAAVGAAPVTSILFLGNSLTIHGPSPDIGWTGNWGMAASAIDKDYVHVLATHWPQATFAVLSLTSFEQNYRAFNIASLDSHLNPPPDLIVVELGDNVADNSEFGAYYSELIGHLVANGHSRVLCTSTWFGSAVINSANRNACSRANTTFVDLTGIATDSRNHAASERAFTDDAVGAHPGDRGMAQIAAALAAAVTTAPSSR
jgi:hypothetical protein